MKRAKDMGFDYEPEEVSSGVLGFVLVNKVILYSKATVFEMGPL